MDQATTETITAQSAETKKEGIKMEKKTTAAKTTTTKTTAAKKTAAAKTTVRKTAAAKKTAQTGVEVTLQWNGNDYTADRLLQSAKDVWSFDLGKDAADFKSAQIYVKPEESRAYVVVNGTDSLSFAI